MLYDETLYVRLWAAPNKDTCVGLNILLNLLNFSPTFLPFDSHPPSKRPMNSGVTYIPNKIHSSNLEECQLAKTAKLAKGREKRRVAFPVYSTG